MDEKPIYSNGVNGKGCCISNAMCILLFCACFSNCLQNCVCKLQWKPCNGNLLRLGCRAPHHNPAISIFLLVLLFKAPCSGNNGLFAIVNKSLAICFFLCTLFLLGFAIVTKSLATHVFFLLYAFSPRQEGMLEKEIWLLQHGNEERRRNLPSFLLLQLRKELVNCWVKVYISFKKNSKPGRCIYRLCKNYQ